MKTIIVNDHIYSHLLNHTREIGESASSILCRLLGLNGTPEKTSLDIQKVFSFLKRPELFRSKNNAGKFLFILAWIYRNHENDFDKVITIEGSRRKYFAFDPKTLLKSGSSVNPRQIPDSPFWVITNNSTAKKCEILFDVLQMFGYEADDINAMLRIVLKP